MNIKSAEFVISNTSYEKCPAPNLPEYAFIGRSNVGKSSLINMLTNSKHLAKTSSKPGKTQLINHFLINRAWYLVDLPGYGWAKVSKSEKQKWVPMIERYILHRENLGCLFILIDSRLDPQPIDLEFIRWAGSHQVPLVIILTKTDKQSKNKTATKLKTLKRALSNDWETLPTILSSSSLAKTGRKEILDYIEGINNEFNAAN